MTPRRTKSGKAYVIFSSRFKRETERDEMRKKTFILVFAMIIFVGLFSGAQAESHCGDDCPPPEPLKYKLYFPLVPKSAPRWGYLSYGYGSEDEIIPGAVLRAPILWDWVETERGIYNWDRVDSIMALDGTGLFTRTYGRLQHGRGPSAQAGSRMKKAVSPRLQSTGRV